MTADNPAIVRAADGPLFLDEIGEMSLEAAAQVVDVRIVAATNAGLPAPSARRRGPLP